MLQYKYNEMDIYLIIKSSIPSENNCILKKLVTLL